MKIANTMDEARNEVSPATAPARLPAPRWALLLGTFFGAGNMKPGPGTWGSLAALALWSALAPWLAPAWRTPAALIGAAVLTAIGIPAATRVARALGKEDPSCVVVDEVAGQMLAFAAVPLHWKSLLAAFLLFRAFDIMKPPPVRQLELLPEGTGIMLDDIGAGLYALAILQLLLHFGVLK
jgi:phosphatidylglycerophosphatase A